jgi:starch phosphorylase
MEFLIGRAMNNALSALDLRDQAAAAVHRTGPVTRRGDGMRTRCGARQWRSGRLAACFLDSMATLGLPSWGYGVRYEYGMFAQSILNGQQVEKPEAWLQDRSPWEFPRANKHHTVRFGGTCEHHGEWAEWHAADSVEAKAFDYVIPGHGTDRVSTLRLWKAAAPSEIDLGAFNTGDYQRAAEFKNRFENISWVLYPNDSTFGRPRTASAPGVFLRFGIAAGHPSRHLPSTAPSAIWPSRWRSISTIPTRRSASPS